MKKILLFFTVFIHLCAYSQTDTEFWFAAPRLTPNHNNHDIEINILTFDQPSVVTISQPANPNSSFNRTITVPAASSYTLKLGNSSGPLPNVETLFGAVRNTGFLITSDNPVQAYYASTTNNSEVYSLKGRNALGTDFIVPTQTDRPNSTGGYSGGKNSVEIVASQDATKVEITPSQDCEGGIRKNTTFTVTLNKGEAYAISAAGTSAAAHLFNTRVRSDKPIAVNYTDDTVAGPGADMLGDQIIPISKAGNNYIIIANYKKSIGSDLTEKAYVFPTENNTTVYVNSVLQTTLNEGDTWQYNLIANNKDAIQLTSDKPIIVLHVTSYDNELGCAVLPPIDCTGSKEISYKPAFGTPNFGIITKKEFIDGFTVNGNSFLIPPQVFQPVNDDDVWYYAVRPMGVSGLIQVKNSKGYFHVGAFDVEGHTCSLGYFSNFNVINLAGITDNSYYRVGETIDFSLVDATDLTGYYWEGPEVFSSTEANPRIENCTEANAGRYVVTASHRDGCQIEPDTFYVHIFPEAHTQMYEICYGNNLTLTAPGSEPYLWSTGATTKDITVSPTSASDYSVTSRQPGFEDRAHFDLTDYFHVSVLDSLRPSVSGDSFICSGTANIDVVGEYDTYLWSTGESTKTITVSQSGDYWVRVTQDDCSGTGYFRVAPAPQITVTVEKQALACEGDLAAAIPYQLTSGEIGTYDIVFDESSKQAGFVDQLGVLLTDNLIQVHLPLDAKPNLYKFRLTLYEKACGESVSFDMGLMIKYGSEILEQRWNDIIGVLNSEFNGGYTFTSFQWYKNGVAIPEAEQSYLYEEPTLSASSRYSVLLTRTDGVSIFTCDFFPTVKTSSAQGIVSRVVERSSQIRVKDNQQSGTVLVWSVTGNLEGRYTIGVGDADIPSPSSGGVYVVQLPNDMKYKIVVK